MDILTAVDTAEIETATEAEPVTPCTTCGAEINGDEAYIDQDTDESVCAPCYDDNHTQCALCDETVNNSSITAIILNNLRHIDACASCRGDLSTCDDCATMLDADHAYNSDGDNTYCEGCYDHLYTTCNGCDQIVSRDDVDGDENCGSCQARVIHRSDFDACEYLGFMDNPSDGLSLGLELEIATGLSAEPTAVAAIDALGSRYVIAKEDGSLGVDIELNTAPASLSYHQNQWMESASNWKRVCTDRKITSHNQGNCGIHVHVSRDPLSQLQIGKLQVFLNALNTADFVTCIAQRTANQYCMRQGKKLTDKHNYDRFSALNLQNSNTIEFRIFRGNTRVKRILKCLEFADSLTRYCGAAEVSIREFCDVDRFLRWLTHSSRKAAYPNLIGYLVEKNYLPDPRQKVIKFNKREDMKRCA